MKDIVIPTGVFHRSLARCAALYQLRFSWKMLQRFSGALGGRVMQPDVRLTKRHRQITTAVGFIKVINVAGIIVLANRLAGITVL
jgi:hypothetical protein